MESRIVMVSARALASNISAGCGPGLISTIRKSSLYQRRSITKCVGLSIRTGQLRFGRLAENAPQISGDVALDPAGRKSRLDRITMHRPSGFTSTSASTPPKFSVRISRLPRVSLEASSH